MSTASPFDQLAQSLFGATVTDAEQRKICVKCKASAEHFKDATSAKEYQISALCQTCQDKIFDA